MLRISHKSIIVLFFLLLVLSSLNCGRRNPTQSQTGGGRPEYPKTPPAIPEDDNPCWSPNGSFIAYDHYDPDTTSKPGIYFINLDGTNPRPLFYGSYLGPDFSKNGRKIAFYVAYGGGIITMNLDSTELHSVSPPGQNGNLNIYVMFAPKWFPDGQWLVFLGGSNPTPPICKMKFDGTEQQVYLPYYGIDFGSFRNDGSKICFTNLFVPAGGNQTYIARIYVSNLDGSDTTRLNPDNYQDNESPCWSPDGSQIAYTWWVFGNGWSKYGINIMNADGTNTRLLVTGGMHPSWSPDGTKIAYKKGTWGDLGVTEARIWVINVDGTGDHQLTHK